jgi:hypothetical protein
MIGATVPIRDVQDMECVANVSHTITGWDNSPHVFSQKKPKLHGTGLMKCLKRTGKTIRQLNETEKTSASRHCQTISRTLLKLDCCFQQLESFWKLL